MGVNVLALSGRGRPRRNIREISAFGSHRDLVITIVSMLSPFQTTPRTETPIYSHFATSNQSILNMCLNTFEALRGNPILTIHRYWVKKSAILRNFYEEAGILEL